jgi:hypothetical protein
MAKTFEAKVRISLIDMLTGPLAKSSAQVRQHTSMMTAEFKKLERGVGTFIGAFAGLATVTREMGRLKEVMTDYSRVQQQILALNVRAPPGAVRGGPLRGTIDSTEYSLNRKALQDTSLALSQRYNVTPTSVLEEIRALKQAGVSLKGAMDAAGPLVALARVTGHKDPFELTRQVVSAATEFRMPMSTELRAGQTGKTDMARSTERMANILLYLRSKNITPEEFLAASKYSGALEATVGATPESFAATLAGLAERQVSGSAAGTLLRSDVGRALKPTKGAIKAMNQYGGFEKFVTEVPVTGRRLKAAMMTQFGMEAGGRMPSDAEWDALAKMPAGMREGKLKQIAEGMAPSAVFAAEQNSPDMVTRSLELANLQASRFVNLTGVWKGGKWIPGLVETLAGDQAAMGTVFEGRHLTRNLALAQSVPAIKEMMRRGQGGIPDNLLEEAMKITNTIDSWESAFTKLANSIERAFIRFGNSAVGKFFLKWIDQLADWIDEISAKFEQMPAAEQWKWFGATISGILVFLGDIIKIAGDFLSGDFIGAGKDMVKLGGKFTAGAAAWDATGKLGGSAGDQALAGVGGALLSQLSGEIISKFLQFFGMSKGGADFTGNLIGAGGVTAAGVMLPLLWEYTKKLFHPIDKGLPDPVGDAMQGLGLDPNKQIDVSALKDSGPIGDFLLKLLGAREVPRDPKLGPNFPTEGAFRVFGWSAGDMKNPGYMPPAASFDESRAAAKDLSDIADATGHPSKGEWPEMLKTAFLSALTQFATSPAYGSELGKGNFGALGGGFGFGLGGTGGKMGGGAWGGGSIGASFITGDPLIDSLFKGEGTGGNWSAVLGHGKGLPGVDLTKMTLTQVLALSARIKAQYGLGAGPMGAFQIVGKTLRGHAAALGMDLDKTLFTPETQQKLFRHILATEGPGAWKGLHGRQFSREQIQHALHYVFGSAAGGVGGGAIGDLGAYGEHGGVSALGGEGLNPSFADKLMKLHELAKARGIDFKIQPGMGYRSYEKQLQIWLSHRGTGRPGARPGLSYHNYGRAGDLQNPDGTSMSLANAVALGHLAPQVGLTWGGVFNDPKHFQLGPAGGAGWIGRRQQQSRLDVHIHDDGVRVQAKGDMPIRANYRGKRMADVGSGSNLSFGANWWNK